MKINMLRVLPFFLLLLNVYCLPVQAAYSPPVAAESAVLMDVGSGQVLYQKNAFQRRPPASTTKILTALLALEGGDLGQVVTISKTAASTGESSIYLQAGENLTLEELIYGALLKSGNDSCVAIAEQIAGTEANFVQLMNEKAKQMGAMDSHFVNCNGLPAEGHYSTAYDLAKLTCYALQNPVFNTVVSTREKVIRGPGWQRHLQNTNQLLDTYTFADGVKTGTTNAAGPCLVASATRDNRRLVSVVLHSANRYGDSKSLLEYGFNNFSNNKVLTAGQVIGDIPVCDGFSPAVQAVSKGDLTVVIPNGRTDLIEKKIYLVDGLTAPVKKEQKIGRVDLYMDKVYIASTDLIASESIERLPAYLILWRKFYQNIG
jgi:D-alanyl-D-alanine carboxypeptidase (penicillin-binding protein 5/6)